MKRNVKWKKYGGIIPIVWYLIVWCLSAAIGGLTDSVLRSIPQMILSWFGIFSVLLLVFWVGRMFLQRNKENCRLSFRVLRKALTAIFILLTVGTVLIGMFFSAFAYKPEHVVEKNGTRMVASVNSFLQEMVYYYEYKNFLFRGTEYIGFEDYGNGSGDPIERGDKPDREYFKDAE